MKACTGLWNWRCIVGGLLVAGFLRPGGLCQGATVYDAAADLTKESIAAGANPNGPWSYGCRAAAASSQLTLFPVSGVSGSWRRVTENVQGWWLAPTADPWSAPTPTVLKNVGTQSVASTYHPFSWQTLAAGAMYVHPGPANIADRPAANVGSDCAVVRWTAPAPGSYLIDTVFTGKDSRGATTDVHVVMNGRELFAGDIRGGMNSPTNVATYSKTVSMAAGDQIDFAVGPGGNGNVCDSTGLAATITLVDGTASRPAAAKTIAYWRFEEGAAGAAATGNIRDSSGNNLHGTPQNGPVYSGNVPTRSIYRTDAVNSCSLSFNGFNQRIFTADHPLFQLGRSLTLEAYVNVQALPTNGPLDFIVIRGDDRPWMDPYWLALLPNGHLCFQIDDGTTPNGATAVKVEAPSVAPLNTWLHVAGTLNDQTGKICLYIDGAMVASTVTSRRPLVALQPSANPGVAIGGPTTPHVPMEYFHGLIDEVRISAEALTPSEFLNAAPKSSHLVVAELSSKPHVLRPAKQPARASFCEVSQTGFHKATVGDLIELEYTYSLPPPVAGLSRLYQHPFLPGTVPQAVEVKQTPNGAVVASPLGTRIVDEGRPGRGTITFYFEAKKPGNDTVTLVIDGSQYTYHFQVDPPPPAAGQTPEIHVYPDELKQGDKLSDGPGRSFDISEPTRLIWVDLQPGRPFPHDTRYVLVTTSGMRSEQGQWWPVLNGKPLWAPAGQGMTNGRTVMAQVDVMGRIDPTRDAIAGQWRATEAGLEVKDTYIAQILLPVPLEKNYQLDVDVTRVRGHDFGFIIPVGLRHCMILLGAWHGTASGIDWVDGRSANDNITTVRPGTFENGRRYSFHIRVSLDDCDQTCAIAVDLDGKPYIEYRGAVARLFMPPHDWEEPKAGCASLCASQGTDVIYHRVRVTRVADQQDNAEATLPAQGRAEVHEPSASQRQKAESFVALNLRSRQLQEMAGRLAEAERDLSARLAAQNQMEEQQLRKQLSALREQLRQVRAELARTQAQLGQSQGRAAVAPPSQVQFRFARGWSSGTYHSPTSPNGNVHLELYSQPRTYKSAARLVDVTAEKFLGTPLFAAGGADGDWGFSCWSFSPDGKYLATGSRFRRVNDDGLAMTNRGRVEVWDAATGIHVTAFEGDYGSVLSVGFSPDGREVRFTAENYLNRPYNPDMDGR